MKLLIVEDDRELRRVLQRGFADEGIQATLAADYDDGLTKGVLTTFDVIVLDVVLPGGSGFDLCADLRKEGIRTPVLMLTARTGVDDRVRGLDGGADDYLTKPFAFRELFARVRALGRRPSGLAEDVFELADLRVNLRARSVERGGRTIRLSTKEFELLEFFVRNVGSVVDRASITSYVWDENHDPASNVLEVLVGRLRQKLDDAYEAKLIHTHRGAGYRFGD